MSRKLWIYVFLMLLGSTPFTAAARADAEADYRQGIEAYQNGDPVSAVKWFRSASDQGHAKAQLYLGVSYKKGEGVAKDDVLALKYFQLAAAQGEADAQNEVGWDYLTGVGAEVDLAKAFTWYKLAAEQGHPMAQYNLGLMYRDGEGTAPDPVEALKWLVLASSVEGLPETVYPEIDGARDAMTEKLSNAQMQDAQARINAWMDKHGDGQ